METSRGPATMIPRRYQLQLLEKAKEQNTIVYLETGCGKTHVAVMLLLHFSDLIRKPSNSIAVFLCPTQVLVLQQAKVISQSTDLKVGKYIGDSNLDSWKLETWQTEIEKHEAFVMTPEILLRNLHHRFMCMENIELLIFDECHHAGKRHPYACIMNEFYHTRTQDASYKLPRILGMTASPIDGKVDRNGLIIAKQLNKIEGMLHAKVCTVKERVELDLVVPCPTEEVEFYNPSDCSNPETQRCALLLSNLKEKSIRRLLASSSDGEYGQGELRTNVEKKAVKNIEKLYNSLEYCLSELGLWCTYHAAAILIGRYESNRDIALEDKLDVESTRGKEAFLRDVLTILKSSLSQDDIQGSDAVTEEAYPLLLSSKVFALIDILKRYRGTRNMRCIVFVERKIATKVLASLLSSRFPSSQFRFQSLAGKNTGMNAMSRKLQQQSVDSFREGEVNVLVSTNVAEEGLDIQSCCLVIRFDLPKTPCSLIQSRGRARCRGSVYIYLVERENNRQLELLEQFKLNEESMKRQALSRSEITQNLEAPEISALEFFQVESTGASISTDCSVSLLHRYCARLARDSFHTPLPEFSYAERLVGNVKCTVRLPTDALVGQVEGRPCASRSDAKRVACLDACKRLYEAGALTDLLLLRSDDPEEPLVSIAPKHKLVAGKAQGHSTIIPDAFSGTWGAAASSIELYAYTLSFIPTPNDRVYVNFGLFLESDLGYEAGNIEIVLQLTQRRLVNTKCSPSGRVPFQSHELQDAKLFQERLFSAILDRKPGSKVTGDWNPNRLYLLLPLKDDLESPTPPIDWECVYKLIATMDYKRPIGLPLNESSGPLVKLFDGSIPLEYVIDSVVQTVYNDYIYCARELIPDLNADNLMVDESVRTRYSSYAHFYKEKHKTTLQYPKEAMLKAKALIQVHNLLARRTTTAAEEVKTEVLVELPLELCRVLVRGLSCGLANGTSLLPSFMHRLEGLLLAIQLRNTLSLSYPAASQVSADLMLEAITTSYCQESFSLEGLELLGDAFLKFAVSERLFLVHNKLQEGELSKLRTSVICNAALEKLGKDRNLMQYIRDMQFCPIDWAAPGRAAFGQAEETSESDDIAVHQRNRTKKTAKPEKFLQGKTIADVVESLIGAHYMQGGSEAAISMMQWFGFEVGVDPSIREKARTRTDCQLGLLGETKILELESLLKYRFENKGLLLEAFTHASCQRSVGDRYQRLEFLGDAVLDILIMKHFYVNSKNMKRDPGLLSDLRSAAVNNECFARVAVRHNLHLYLLHNCRDLEADIKQYVKYVKGSMTETESCHGWVGDANPKVLSDLVESLAGAVFLDSNFNLDTVWRVFREILRPLVTPETLRLEPVRELRELCQSEKFGNPKFDKKVEGKGNVVVAVTVHVNGEEITETSRKSDRKNPEKAASILVLANLKERGYQHFSRRLREQKALYAHTFSDLVDVPEGSLHETLADEAGAIVHNDLVDRSEGDVVWDSCDIIRNGASRSGIVQTLDLGSDGELETVWASLKNASCKAERAQPSSSQKVSSVQSDGDSDVFFDALPHLSDVEDIQIAEADVMDASLDKEMATNILESGLRLQDIGSQKCKFSSSALFNRVDGNAEFAKLCSVLKGSSTSEGRYFTPMSNSSLSTQIPQSDVGTFEAYERSRIVAPLASKPNSLAYLNKSSVESTTSGSQKSLFNRVDGNAEFAKLCSVLKGSSTSEGRNFTSMLNSSLSTQIPQSDVGTFEAYERSRLVAPLASKPNSLAYLNKSSSVESTTSGSAIPAKRCGSSQLRNPGNLPSHFLESGSSNGWVGASHGGAGEDVAHINGKGNHVFLAAGNVGASFASHQLKSCGPASTKSAPGFTASLALVICHESMVERDQVMAPSSPLHLSPSNSGDQVVRHALKSSVPLNDLGTTMEFRKGEARSLLNELCVKRRWKDPVYTCILEGGVSHDPVFTYKVSTTLTVGEKAYEIDVDGEPVKDSKGAKDSAAARALMWFHSEGILPM